MNEWLKRRLSSSSLLGIGASRELKIMDQVDEELERLREERRSKLQQPKVSEDEVLAALEKMRDLRLIRSHPGCGSVGYEAGADHRFGVGHQGGPRAGCD